MKVDHSPRYMFAMPVGPVHKWFAWHPVRFWWGQSVWLKTVGRQKHKKKSFLDGPDWEFWAYCHAPDTHPTHWQPLPETPNA